MLLTSLLLCASYLFQVFTITQAEVSIVFTDVDVTFNPEYFAQDFEVFLLDEGIDNQIFVNFTVIKTIPISSTAYFKMLGATMGEYKINTGFEFHSGICDLVDEPILFGHMLKKMGMGRCPCEIGNYGNEAFEIDLNTLPDEFSPNKYVVDVWATDDGDKIFYFRLYFTIQ